MKNNNNEQKRISSISKITTIKVVATIAVLLVAIVIMFTKNGKTDVVENSKEVAKSTNTVNGDLIIPIANITEKATIYKYDELKNSMEIIAVKASDGTIRTAFNTCQVCYDSGRGYYEQEGDNLVCQNCGNQFSMDQVQVTKGGCNPVPIADDAKKVDETNITISKDFLTQAEVVFENWKN